MDMLTSVLLTNYISYNVWMTLWHNISEEALNDWPKCAIAKLINDY